MPRPSAQSEHGIDPIYDEKFVSGHEFTRAVESPFERGVALATAMTKPPRNGSSEEIARATRTFFATTRTHSGRRLFQSDRNANLMIEVLRSCMAQHELRLDDFVVMPDHVHPLITVDGQMTIEKAMQLIKGRFSYRLKKELGYLGEVWQRGFSEVSVYEESSLNAHRTYIAQNPVRAGLVSSPEEYPYCFMSLAKKKASRG
jgi:putative transposase